MNRLLFSPDRLLLTRTERFEAWLWSKRWAHALLGWVLLFFPEREPDELGDVLKFMGLITLCALSLALGMALGVVH
ncbi:MAG TPA: hypothetical protein VGV60_14960 [Candidatus Polarisedimenticolia bacterium]|jgi:hypothetical protein|nr:hypothetical protein [Candidatus Polarisedimenticolia bacterium]